MSTNEGRPEQMQSNTGEEHHVDSIEEIDNLGREREGTPLSMDAVRKAQKEHQLKRLAEIDLQEHGRDDDPPLNAN
ncbi:MAG: hypothetical protein AAF752_13710 [Bacteroidota bacterium]